MSGNDVTAALDALAAGDSSAADRVLPLVYSELRALAGHLFARERSGGAGHTLQPTALVHEAYARLIGPAPARAESRAHFMALAAQVMRRVLIDHARAKLSQKRDGGARQAIELDQTPALDAMEGAELLDLDAALREFAALYPRAASVVEMRFFGGMTAAEIAALLNVGDATVERDWTLARGWLHRRLSGGQ